MACLAANSSRLPPRQTGPHVLNSHDQGRHGPEIKKKTKRKKRKTFLGMQILLYGDAVLVTTCRQSGKRFV
jgi:hypothetical protein